MTEKRQLPRCLYCNAPLRPETRSVEREPTDRDYLRFKSAKDRTVELDKERAAALARGDTDLALRIAKRRSGIRSRAPHFYTRDGRTLARVDIPTGAYGRDGNGYFCTRRCGEAFGIEAAKAGYRTRRAEGSGK